MMLRAMMRRPTAATVCSTVHIGEFLHHTRMLSLSAQQRKDHFKVVVVGGGTAGAAMSSKLGRKFGKDNVAVLEAADTHYYQPAFTLVGGGMKPLAWTARPMDSVLSGRVTRIRQRAAAFAPADSELTTDDGALLSYDYLVVAPGLQLRFDLVKGLPEALESQPNVCSNYDPKYAVKTFPALQAFQSGNAVFTFPNTPIKCPGAPQKICYIADEYFRKTGKRDKATVMYNTSLGVLFSAKKYADVLWEVVKKRGIQVNLRQNLVQVDAEKNEAVFDVLGEDGKAIEQKRIPYSFLHVGAPCSPVEALRLHGGGLTNAAGWVTVNKSTLQHTRFHNVFGLGDCTDAPTPKTAAAVSSQSGIVYENLLGVMDNHPPQAVYDGYTSCPLVTGYSKCIMAEFDYNFEPLETFPINQRAERRSMFLLKRDVMPQLYWHGLLKGYWNGPATARTLLHLGMNKV